MSSSDLMLRTFLEHPSRPPGTLSLGELRGFLFAVTNAPDMILPSEWVPAIFDDQDAEFGDADEAQRITTALMEEYNAVGAASLHADAMLPPGCEVRDEPLSNLDEDAPLAAWSRGFKAGHQWAEESWNAVLPPVEGDEEDDGEVEDSELGHELGAVLMVLCFFSSRRIADAFCAETHSKDLPALARSMVTAIPTAVAQYVSLGRALRSDMMPSSPEAAWSEIAAPEPYRRSTAKIGRNDPCPCGSGRKYKFCCAPQ